MMATNNNCGVVKRDDLMELPAGFRFHPTDEELITHYLSNKVLDTDFSAVAIGEVDMNKVEPWDLPWRAKLGEKEWYFFCVRDKKYPTGLRTNRATASGYWKATGKDKEIYRGKTLVGMKKTLVFYRGRAPKGEKSNWVCHEYRLEGKFSLHNLPKPTKNDWVISRVFQKTSGGKKVHISGLVRMNSIQNELLPPLMDHHHHHHHYSTKPEIETESGSGSGHVHCFSNTTTATTYPPPPPSEDNNNNFIGYNNNNNFMSNNNNMIGNNNFPSSSSNPNNNYDSSYPAWVQFPTTVHNPGMGGLQYPGGSGPIQDPLVLRSFLAANYGGQVVGLRRDQERETMSQETGMSTDNSSTAVVSNLQLGKNKAFQQPQDNLDCIWNYE